jgi:CheY-like chemotaxis protein
VVDPILVADDDPDIRRLLSAALRSWGFAPEFAEDGMQACALVDRADRPLPSIVLLDWMLPGLDGVSVCRHLRARPDGTSPFVLMLTAKAGKTDLVEALDAGADDYVTKPFDLRELRARLLAAKRRSIVTPPPFSAQFVAAPGAIVGGRYRLEGKLGEGGMGVVWAARHIELDREVAVKVLHPNLLSNAEAHGRFELEARAASRLTSANVASVLDYGVTPSGLPWLVMERLHGESLCEAVSSRGPMPPAEVVRVVEQVASAIDEAHAIGVLHRDLKPENVFFARPQVGDASGQSVAKVLDFGIAKLLDHADPELRKQQAPLTKIDAIMGTQPYMSPEQLNGSVVGASSDIWALGATIYFALTGVSPFDGNSVGDIALKICVAPIPTITALRPDLSSDVDAWFAKCCHRDPRQRFFSARAASNALTQVLGVVPLPLVRRAPPLPLPLRKRA